MLRIEKEKIVVYHGTEPGEIYDLENDPDEFETSGFAGSPRIEDAFLKQCFDASVFTMDPDPPRLGPFDSLGHKNMASLKRRLERRCERERVDV